MSQSVAGHSAAEAASNLPLHSRAVALPIPTPIPARRLQIQGKFFSVTGDKHYIRGVTYGPFRPRQDGGHYRTAVQFEQDFAQMAAHGVNTIRTYTTPPVEFLDVAARHGLRVFVGLPWEQHVAFLSERSLVRAIEQRMSDAVRSIAGHPAIAAYAVGNEIPAGIVRWYGARRVERFIERLYGIVKELDRDAQVTYANYPPTEYLSLPFLDFACFNVYLESRARFASYLSRLQTLAGDRPLVIGEIGFDSHRSDEATQARMLDWQVRETFAAGCAGAFVFSWTDAWHRGGVDIDDWAFGLTDANGQPKAALVSVSEAFKAMPFQASDEESSIDNTSARWPKVTVAVCTHNGGRTLRECLEHCSRLEYPNYELLVINDGSTDDSADIAGQFRARLISTSNHGLSHARNVALKEATGQIIAYIDDDAYPDRHWLKYLATTFASDGDDFAGVGGPNILPPDDGLTAQCVARSPGGPTHVLLTDVEAEHIPGCNMAFRRDRLLAIGGFDEQFRIAGDDVDVCWRLQARGWKLGFSPAAVVWHHRRNTVKGYFKQQLNYGRAEAMLERKWPEKYNALGHLMWSGRLYGTGYLRALQPWRRRIYHGTWGDAPFQPGHEAGDGWLSAIPTMPEWYLVTLAVGVVAVMSFFAPALIPSISIFAAMMIITVVQAVARAVRTQRSTRELDQRTCLQSIGLTACLHLMQPAARLLGRIQRGLTPLRRRGRNGFAWVWPRKRALWFTEWRSPNDRLKTLEESLRGRGAVVARGGEFDRWDLEVRGGAAGGCRILAVVEEHGNGDQMMRVSAWPRLHPLTILLAVLFGLSALALKINGEAFTAAIETLLAATACLMFWALYESSAALAIVLSALAHPNPINEEAKTVVHETPAARESESEEAPLAASTR